MSDSPLMHAPCLHEIFEAQADTRPADLALVCGPECLTYGHLEEAANRLARHLRALGAGPGTLVALYLERSARAIVTILAVLKSGSGYVPIDPMVPEDRVRHILSDADAKVLVTEQAHADQAAGLFPGPTVVLDSEADVAAIAGQPADRLARTETHVSETDLCYVIYTSGTTGRPKGIMTEHRNVVAFTTAFKEPCRLDASDRVYQGFSLGFDGSVEEIWMAFSSGATLVVGPPNLARLGNETAHYLTDHEVTFLSTVPTFLTMITEDVPSLRVIVVSGEPCPPELVRQWVRHGRRMLNVYGPTETTVNTTVWDCRPGATVTIGRPLAGYVTYILDEDLQPVLSGTAGELYIGGVGVARGYLNQPGLTRRQFLPNPFAGNGSTDRLYRTGDLVRQADSGELLFLGRIDGQVKVRGYRIELAEIESVLREIPGISAAAVKVVDRDGLQELAAFVVAAENAGPLDRSAVLDRLQKRMPSYMNPGFLDEIDELPTLASGKTDRNRLPEPATPLVRAAEAMVPPRNDLERTIADVWERLLETTPVSVEADFFLDHGGYSLLAARLVTLLRAEHGIEVSLRDVYEHPTIARLAVVVTRTGRPATDPEKNAPARRRSRDVYAGLKHVERLSAAVLQALSIPVLYAHAAGPYIASGLIAVGMIHGAISVSLGVALTLGVMVLSLPVLIATSIAVKWLVLGRIRPGEHPLRGVYHVRFWFVNRVHSLSGIGLFSGTPVMSLYYRLMGATVGSWCVIDTPFCAAFDLVVIGDESTIGSETQLLGYRAEDGMLRLGSVAIGRRCFVGIHCALGLDVQMGDDARLDDLSLLADGAALEEGRGYRGSPARPAAVSLPEVDAAATASQRPFRSGVFHFLLAEALLLFLLLTLVPGIMIVVPSFTCWGIGWGIVACLVAIPVSVVSFCFLVAGVKVLVLRRIQPGTYPVESGLYLRKWFVDALLGVSRSTMHALYTTIYLPPWLRMLGARIGRRAEISTVSQVTPDLIDIADESFFADGSMIGGRHFFRGHVRFDRNRIGRRTFVGNNAILPLGSHLGNGCLLGVLSIPPAESEITPDGSEWLGAPSFRLPYRKKVGGFDASVTYQPTPKLYAQRLAIDAVRILIPPLILALAGSACFLVFLWAWPYFPWWALVVLAPLAAMAAAVAGALVVVALKWIVMGRFEPVIKPLWSTYVWWNEVINGAYETVGAPALSPLVGTPLFNAYLRLMGCRIGRNAFVETTLFSEFDLVDIGDHAALNPGVVVQNHLFEDRIMKSSFLRIGDDCSVGNMAVILYDTEMQPASWIGPLSLLMKGETVPPASRSLGVPTRIQE